MTRRWRRPPSPRAAPARRAAPCALNDLGQTARRAAVPAAGSGVRHPGRLPSLRLRGPPEHVAAALLDLCGGQPRQRHEHRDAEGKAVRCGTRGAGVRRCGGGWGWRCGQAEGGGGGALDRVEEGGGPADCTDGGDGGVGTAALLGHARQTKVR
eukprot:scaffold74073_cov74-Phaeocystis_antarctica.AAC.2